MVDGPADDSDIDTVDSNSTSLTPSVAHRRVRQFVIATLAEDETVMLSEIEGILPEDSTEYAWSGVKQLLQTETVQYAESGNNNTFERGPSF